MCDENGLCAGVFRELPEAYRHIEVINLRNYLIIPGYCDMHLHAGQFHTIGRGMDLQLLQWLNDLAYPEEAKYQNPMVAMGTYHQLAFELKNGFTTRAAIFSTAHTEATEILMEELEKTKLKTYVGRVNMDSNAPDYIREPSADDSFRETLIWLNRVERRNFKYTRPILTPRFVPSCSPPLLELLGTLAQQRGLPVQSHLDENMEEIELVRSLYPECPSYAAVYDKNCLLGSKTLMAHCIHMTDEECALLKERGAYIVHCPTSNTNMCNGIAPIRKYLDMGLHVCLGSDISGGHTLDMSEIIRQTIGVSRSLSYLDETHPAGISAREAFYLATEGGGSFFGKAGSFLPGYEFDAVIVDDSDIRQKGYKLKDRFEKLIYQCTNMHVIGKYVGGQEVF